MIHCEDRKNMAIIQQYKYKCQELKQQCSSLSGIPQEIRKSDRLPKSSKF